jgi:hypothetical protein
MCVCVAFCMCVCTVGGGLCQGRVEQRRVPPQAAACVSLCHCVRRSMYVYVNVLVQECVAQGCSVSVCNNVRMAVRQRASV